MCTTWDHLTIWANLMEEFLELNNNPRVENENRLSSRPSVPTAMNELKEVLCVACTNPPQVEPPVFRTNGQNILGSPSNFSVTPYTPSARSRPSTRFANLSSMYAACSNANLFSSIFKQVSTLRRYCTSELSTSMPADQVIRTTVSPTSMSIIKKRYA
jgi:hypothetical protein